MIFAAPGRYSTNRMEQVGLAAPYKSNLSEKKKNKKLDTAVANVLTSDKERRHPFTAWAHGEQLMWLDTETDWDKYKKILFYQSELYQGATEKYKKLLQAKEEFNHYRGWTETEKADEAYRLHNKKKENLTYKETKFVEHEKFRRFFGSDSYRDNIRVLPDGLKWQKKKDRIKYKKDKQFWEDVTGTKYMTIENWDDFTQSTPEIENGKWKPRTNYRIVHLSVEEVYEKQIAPIFPLTTKLCQFILFKILRINEKSYYIWKKKNISDKMEKSAQKISKKLGLVQWVTRTFERTDLWYQAFFSRDWLRLAIKNAIYRLRKFILGASDLPLYKDLLILFVALYYPFRDTGVILSYFIQWLFKQSFYLIMDFTLVILPIILRHICEIIEFAIKTILVFCIFPIYFSLVLLPRLIKSFISFVWFKRLILIINTKFKYPLKYKKQGHIRKLFLYIKPIEWDPISGTKLNKSNLALQLPAKLLRKKFRFRCTAFLKERLPFCVEMKKHLRQDYSYHLRNLKPTTKEICINFFKHKFFRIRNIIRLIIYLPVIIIHKIIARFTRRYPLKCLYTYNQYWHKKIIKEKIVNFFINIIFVYCWFSLIEEISNIEKIDFHRADPGRSYIGEADVYQVYEPFFETHIREGWAWQLDWWPLLFIYTFISSLSLTWCFWERTFRETKVFIPSAISLWSANINNQMIVILGETSYTFEFLYYLFWGVMSWLCYDRWVTKIMRMDEICWDDHVEEHSRYLFNRQITHSWSSWKEERKYVEAYLAREGDIYELYSYDMMQPTLDENVDVNIDYGPDAIFMDEKEVDEWWEEFDRREAKRLGYKINPHKTYYDEARYKMGWYHKNTLDLDENNKVK